MVLDEIDDGATVAASTERVLVLSDPTIGTTASVLGVNGSSAMPGREGGDTLVNGVLAPDIATTAGALERWRILNASASGFHRLALDGQPLHVIASDGGRLAAPVAVEELLFAPGEPAEVVVAPSRAGTVRLRAATTAAG